MLGDRRNDNNTALMAEAKDIAVDFIDNLLALVEGQFINSIIMSAEDEETRSYIRLLPLFEDVREIIDYKIEMKGEIKENTEFDVTLHLHYISQESHKKRNELKFNLAISESVSEAGYNIISSIKD